jgi:hypothetical protein
MLFVILYNWRLKMSKLSIIKNSLETNKEVSIIKVNEPHKFSQTKEELKERTSYENISLNSSRLDEYISFYIAPKNGLYNANELQSFMTKLIPDMLPDRENKFDVYGNIFYFGNLYFYEIFGKEEIEIKRKIMLNDDELISPYGNDLGRIGESRKGINLVNANDIIDITRKIGIFAFPDENIAKDLSNRDRYQALSQKYGEMFGENIRFDSCFSEDHSHGWIRTKLLEKYENGTIYTPTLIERIASAIRKI